MYIKLGNIVVSNKINIKMDDFVYNLKKREL